MLIITFLLAIISVSRQCYILKGLSILSTTDDINQNIKGLEGPYLNSCLALLFERGYYTEVSQRLADIDDLSLSDRLSSAAKMRASKINGFIELLDMPQSTIEPFLCWAQNMTHILVSVKLSHRTDSPPCVNVKQEQAIAKNVKKTMGIVRIETVSDGQLEKSDEQPEQPDPYSPSDSYPPMSNTSSSSIHYTSYCIVSHQRVFFNLDMNFWKSVDYLELKKEGVGTLTLLAKKSQYYIWRYLDSAKRRWPIWYYMKDKYSSPMRAYFEMIEREEDESAKKKKKRKKIVMTYL